MSLWGWYIKSFLKCDNLSISISSIGSIGSISGSISIRMEGE